MLHRHYSLASLKDEVEALIREGDLNTPLVLIEDFVGSVIADPFSIAKVFSSPELDELCVKIGAAVASTLEVPVTMPMKGRVAYLATEFYHHGGHTPWPPISFGLCPSMSILSC